MPPTRYMHGGRERSDEERRAIFAKMGGRGRSSSSSAGSEPLYKRDASGGREEGIYDGSKSKRDVVRDSESTQQWLERNPGAELPVSSAVLVPPLGKIGSSMLAALKKMAPSLASGLGSMGLDSWNDKHPTANPIVKHYVAMGADLLGYVSAITGLLAVKSGIKAGASKIDVPIPGTGGAWLPLNEAVAIPFNRLGQIGSKIGALVDKVTPTKVKSVTSFIYDSYNKLADLTGATITDALNVGKNVRAVRFAGQLKDQANQIATLATHLKGQQLQKVSDALDEAHRLSMAGLPGAAKLYQQAAAAFTQATKGSAESKRLAAEMLKLGKRLGSEATANVVKAGLVAVGGIAKEVYDEYDIANMQRDAEAAFRRGETWTPDPSKPMTKLEQAIAMTAGVHGNAAEKNFRYGGPELKQATAAYRAAYKLIGEAEASGELSKEQAEKARLAVSANGPKQLGGKAMWLFAPAAASYLKWKVGDYVDRVKATKYAGVVDKVIDIDTIGIRGIEGTIRAAGLNGPEVKKDVQPGSFDEYLGQESKKWATEKLMGRVVRVVGTHDKSKRPDGSIVGPTESNYGRDLGYYETLPRPFDKLLSIPVIGRLLPAQDVNLEAIEKGWALPKQAYERLEGGKHDRRFQYDEAAARAIAERIGVNDRAAAAASGMPQIPTYQPFYDRKVEDAARAGFTIPSTPQDDSSVLWGAGLMATGQSGVFKSMNQWHPSFTGISGNIAAQAWNAYLAGRGITDYNEKALRNPIARSYRPPAGVPTAADRRDAEILAGTWRPE